MLTPQPSRATIARWGTIARHAINVEIALMFVALFSIFLAIGYGSYVSTIDSYGDPGSLFSHIFRNADLPILTFFLSWIHLGCLSNHRLNPVYALCMSLFMAGLTAVAIWTWVVTDPDWLGDQYSFRYTNGSSIQEGEWAPVSIRDTFGGIIGILYLTQMSLAARAIHNARTAPTACTSKAQSHPTTHNRTDIERAIPSAPPTYYPGEGGGYFYSSYRGTAESSVMGDGEDGRPATVFSDLTTVKGDGVSVVGEKEVGSVGSAGSEMRGG